MKLVKNTKKIYIKSLFSGWHEVSEIQAIRWATHILNDSNCKKETIIEQANRRLRGATLESLGVV